MKKFLFFSLILVLAACSEDEASALLELSSEKATAYNSSCQTDTIRFSTNGTWTAKASDEWITLVQTQGSGDGKIPVYIQQNDDEQQRQAFVTISTEKGKTLQVSLTQRPPGQNGSSAVDITTNYGLGWGYDLKQDVADISGLRGQVLDAALLRNDYGNNIIMYDNAAHTDLLIESGNSHQELQQHMGAGFSGEADLFIAGAKVSVEYSNQINETKDYRYVWCRDLRSVKMAYLFNLDYGEENVARYCTTKSFRDAVKKDSPQDFVRKFGTHLITRSTLGGKLDYYFTLSQSVKTEIERVVTYVQVKILFIKKSWTDVDESVWTEVKRDFQARFQVAGGGDAGKRLSDKLQLVNSIGQPLDDPTLFEAWSARFVDPNNVNMNDLVMIDFDIIPIWQIVETLNEEKAAAIEEYVTNTYLSRENALK